MTTRLTSKRCNRCMSNETEKWWKCCPTHTSEQGQDVLCEECVKELHPEKGIGVRMESDNQLNFFDMRMT